MSKNQDREQLVGARWGALAAALLALSWGLAPALPALTRGELLGHGLTDLYPSVWGMWWFAAQQPALPTHTELLGAPGGMRFVYSSPIKGWLAAPLVPLLGVVGTWNLLVIGARVATVGCAYLAGRAWGLGKGGALVAVAVFGAAPFFHGYAVEGIVEGTDGWTLALWAWAVGRRRYGAGAIALGLTVLSSWYLGACACLLAFVAAPMRRGAPLTLLGILLAAPQLVAFVGMAEGSVGIDPGVRRAMGAHLSLAESGILGAFHPFAKTTWLGGITLALAVWSRWRGALLALVPAVLSLGLPLLYSLPVLEMMRFPYRWHAATLAILALAAGRAADRLGRRAPALAPVIALEGLLLSPVEPIIPGASGQVPGIYEQVEGVLLELPGPRAMPPGQVNPSRQRARYLLYFQTSHGAPSPWELDLNGLRQPGPDWLGFLASWDPLAGGVAVLPGDAVDRLRAHGVDQVMIQKEELGAVRADRLLEGLREQGAKQIAGDGQRVLLAL